MATRVLNTIKDNNRLIGFRVICSLKKYAGEQILNLTQARSFYKEVESFENVKYVGNGQWEGVECGIDKFPVQDKQGHFIKQDEFWFVLGKMYSDDTLKGYKLMDLKGDVYYKSELETVNLGLNQGLINAKLVSNSDNTGYNISALRGSFRKFNVDKSKEKGSNSQMDESIQKQRYSILSDMFGAKEKGLISDKDIAFHVGAKTSSEYSQKIHEYLGEPMNVSDNDILKKLHSIYVSKQNVKPQGVQENTPRPSGVGVKLTDKEITDIERMQSLVAELTKAAEVYYSGEDEVMSNFEYDKKYDELEALEKKTGIILAGSVTQKIGFEIKSKLPKIKHGSRMMSLDKTKDRQDLSNSLGGQPGFLGWKLDGLTLVASYENGELVSVVTRGDGVTGEDVTHNAKFFKGLPLHINHTDRLVIRGEGLISYKTFEEINSKITKIDDKYKNPRNLASGSVRQLDSKIAKSRNVHVITFSVVEGFDNLPNYTDKLEAVRQFGFDIVDYIKVTKDTVVSAIENFEKRVSNYEYPTDGLVITIDNIDYGEALGTTSKFPRNSKAFKWKDEEVETALIEIDWSASRTGAINPVAVFKPVDIDGTTVTRASVHNVSIVKELKLGYGDIVSIYKANMIIPQVAVNTTKSGTIPIPTECPVCHSKTSIVKALDAEVLMCTNPDCTAKHIGGLTHFVGRDAMNIDGLSEATLERLVNEGMVHDYKDLYHISDYADKIVKLEGFGKASYAKMYKAIEKSRECELPAFIYALGIPQMGRTTSKDVCKALDYDLEKIMSYTFDDYQGIAGVGSKTALEIVNYFEKNRGMVRELAKEMTFKAMPKVNRNSSIAGMTFCITGDVYTFKNRKELQAKIESLGAKAASSVSAKTNYLINNDTTSGSNKNQTAKQLGVPIISEADFLKLIGE